MKKDNNNKRKKINKRREMETIQLRMCEAERKMDGRTDGRTDG